MYHSNSTGNVELKDLITLKKQFTVFLHTRFTLYVLGCKFSRGFCAKEQTGCIDRRTGNSVE